MSKEQSLLTCGRRNFTKIAFAALATVPALGWPQSTKTTVVAPMAPGGSTDYIARVVAQHLGEALGQPAIVENKAGATGAIGAVFVARSAPDGSTLLVAPSSVMIAPLIAKTSYDPDRDFKTIGLIGKVETLIVANKNRGFQNLPDLIQYAKKNPGKLTYGSNGQGSTLHLAVEYLQMLTGTEMLHVPYKGISLAETAVLSNEIAFVVTNTTSVLQHIKAGTLVPLAITSTARSGELPDVPNASATVPGYEVDTWAGLYAPAATPETTVIKLNSILNSFLREPKTAESMRARGVLPTPGSAAEAQQYQAKESAMWKKVIANAKAAGRLY